MTKMLVRYGYVPFMIVCVVGTASWIASRHYPLAWISALVAVGVVCSFAAERAVPYEPAWNRSIDGDISRDAAHATVNELLMLASVATIPAVAALLPWHSTWPGELPFSVQLLGAVLLADFGITTVHLASHRVGWLWRLHAVHHSIRRTYGLNGLMKHPVHQALETLGGVAPLLALGVPVDVAAALAACVAVQLLLQHSNVDYAVGPLGKVLALNTGHRFHHLKWPGVGDVNFGLFTLVWDRLYGTYSFDPGRRFTSDDLGIAAEPDYPSSYVRQLAAPFRRRVAAVSS